MNSEPTSEWTWEANSLRSPRGDYFDDDARGFHAYIAMELNALEARVATAEEKAATMLDELEMGWGIIANVDWQAQSDEWRDAAVRWRAKYHERLNALSQPAGQPAKEGK